MRILVAGGPRVGKTTWSLKTAQSMSAPYYGTDSLISKGWSEASEEAATWLDRPGPWIIEGVAVPRALRKWLASHRDGLPCEVLYWGMTPFHPWTKGQASMAAGCQTVMTEIRRELLRRGLRIEPLSFDGDR